MHVENKQLFLFWALVYVSFTSSICIIKLWGVEYMEHFRSLGSNTENVEFSR